MTSRHFRKKPVEIEAIQVHDAIRIHREDHAALPWWLRRAIEGGDVACGQDYVVIVTLEGQMIGNAGDWIICGTMGELYPCKNEVFEQVYEEL
jgi:hypothetical protein